MASRLDHRWGSVHRLLQGLILTVGPGLLAQNATEVPQEPARKSEISFARQIAPIFAQKCLTCHGPEKAKGGYRLDSFNRALKPGDSVEAPIQAGDPAHSELYRRITTIDADERMPQKDDSLAQEQINLIQQWIKQGALFDGTDADADLIRIMPQVARVAPPTSYPRSMPVLALAFSPNGQELAANGCREVLCWSPSDGRLLRRLNGTAERTLSLAYSSDGRLLAAAGGDPGRTGEAMLFDAERGEVLRVFGPYNEVVLTSSFSHDGQRLVLGGGDNSIRICGTATGAEQLIIQQHADWVMSVRFSPGDERLVSASRDRTARIYDSKTGDLEATYTEHNAPVLAAVFTEDGASICSAGRDKKIHLWTIKDGKKSGEIAGFGDEILQLAVHGDWLFCCSADKKAYVCSIKDRKLVHTLSGHSDWVYSLAINPSQEQLASGSFDGEVRLWDVAAGKAVSAFHARPTSVAAK